MKIPQILTLIRYWTLIRKTNELRGVEKKNGESFSTFSASVPRPAFEILNINRRKQILFTTKSHVFTYI
jgi:hypothetical protein